MKIIEARTIVVGTPWRELAFLELATDEGLVGLSEARMVNKTGTLLACIDELAPRYVIGTDPFDVERLAWNVLRAVEIVAAVRDAVGPDVQILIEMHGRFSPATAIAVAALLEPYDPEWIEEPVPSENPKALARVRAATRLPIATGERAHTMEDMRVLIEEGLVDVVQADLTHFGGFLPMKRLAGWADAYSLLMAPHNVCGPVGTMANVHFAVATPNYKVLEHFNDFADSWVHDLVDHAPREDAADGCFAAPDRPGIGLRLNHDLCARHPRTGGRIRLFEEGWERRGS